MSSILSPQEITKRLLDLCAQNGVMCLYAVESGSRAWGFASTDSDYDVRFLYIRKTTDYLLIDRPRDVIEHMGPDDLDMVGWDAMKALKLISKSNPSIVEWLTSPSNYYKNEKAYAILHDVLKQYFSPTPLAYHYMSLATNHDVKYLEGHETVAPKKYLYALRAVLSAKYVVEQRKPAPIIFEVLVAKSNLDEFVVKNINQLLALKSQTKEKQHFPRNEILDAFIAEQLHDIDPKQIPVHQTQPMASTLDDAMTQLLKLAE